MQKFRDFKILLESTTEKGFVHYEISNFAKEGYYSKHNSIYWLGGHYVGFGPSAHSFNGTSRQWNVSNMKQYTSPEKIDHIVAEKEILTTIQQFNEYVMTSLRTSWGCDVEHIQNVFGKQFADHLNQKITPFVRENKVERILNNYFLTDYGKLFADGIAAELFI